MINYDTRSEIKEKFRAAFQPFIEGLSSDLAREHDTNLSSGEELALSNDLAEIAANVAEEDLAVVARPEPNNIHGNEWNIPGRMIEWGVSAEDDAGEPVVWLVQAPGWPASRAMMMSPQMARMIAPALLAAADKADELRLGAEEASDV